MIVQSAPEGQPRFVIEQTDHARMCGQLARAFGNAEFATLDPREPMEYIVTHHDEGWAALDAQAKRDRNTGLPYHLTQTPLADLVDTSARSPEFNEQHHPFSGLMSSMHTYGLYHGRYGLSDFLFIDRIPPELKANVDAMLQAELARQARLKTQLPAAQTDEQFIFHNYKLVQFFDTLGLYFHMTHETQRGEATLKNVPMRVGQDVTVTIKPSGTAGHYAISPYPFQQEQIEVWVEGRYLTPQADSGATISSAPKVRQSLVLVKGDVFRLNS